jgi:tyrosyl-tRNA synthetase
MVGGLRGGKMSASDVGSKIDLLIRKLFGLFLKAFCAVGNVDENPLLTLLQHVVVPLLKLMYQECFVIPREDQYGGKLEYDTCEHVHDDFKSQLVPAFKS